MERPSQPWPRMRSRVRVTDRPIGWAYIGAGVLMAIGVAAIVNADRHTEEHRQRRGARSRRR